MYNLKNLLGRVVMGTDTELGQIEDINFDADRWRVRYLVVEAGDWLEGRRLLLSTRAFPSSTLQSSTIPAAVTRDQVRNSPLFSLTQPFTRQAEIEVHEFYGWPFYWEGDHPGGIGPDSPAAIPLIELAADVREQMVTGGALENPNLNRLTETLGQSIQARDGAAGTLVDMVVQAEDWNILYLIVNAGGLLGSKLIQLAPQWVSRIDPEEQVLEVDLEKETVQNSPVWDER